MRHRETPRLNCPMRAVRRDMRLRSTHNELSSEFQRDFEQSKRFLEVLRLVVVLFFKYVGRYASC